jgi:hypothetical protein
LSDEPFHEVEFLVGIKAEYSKDGTIRLVKPTKLWQTKPQVIPGNVRLLRVKIEVPESFFAVTATVKGRIESRLQEEYVALIEELEDSVSWQEKKE